MTSVLSKCLQDFPHMGTLRNEQKTYLVNLATGKDVFAILPTASVSPLNKVAITEQSQGVIYVLQSRFTLSLDLFRRTSRSLKTIA